MPLLIHLVPSKSSRWVYSPTFTTIYITLTSCSINPQKLPWLARVFFPARCYCLISLALTLIACNAFRPCALLTAGRLLITGLQDRFFPDKDENLSQFFCLFTLQRMTFPFQQINDITCRNPFSMLNQLDNCFANRCCHELVLYGTQSIILYMVFTDTVLHQTEGWNKKPAPDQQKRLEDVYKEQRSLSGMTTVLNKNEKQIWQDKNHLYELFYGTRLRESQQLTPFMTPGEVKQNHSKLAL